MMLRFQQSKLLLLMIVCGGVFVVLGKSIFHPAITIRNTSLVTLPTSVFLNGWQFLESRSLYDQTSDRPSYLSGRLYRYRNTHSQLNIQMRYLVNTNGDVSAYIQDYTLLKVKLEDVDIYRQVETGSYSLFVDGKYAYLSACINPHGSSTVFAKEFKHNRNFYDIRYRLLPWLLGQPLKDERCLWVQMSTPIRSSSPESSYTILKTVWVTWHQWCQAHFPAS
jgi:cyanosortase A-associated protein